MPLLTDPMKDPLNLQLMKIQRSVADPTRCSHQHLAVLAIKAADLPRDGPDASVMPAPVNFVYSDC